MLIVSNCPTATANFSSLACTVADAWVLHCKKIAFYREMYYKKKLSKYQRKERKDSE